jgi:cyclophilin family peptidyl-prolyl cis-trans isomerase/HEAT repeat protein
MRYVSLLGVVAVAVAGSACASAPVKPPAAPVISADQKMSWILRLEDQRILKAPAPPPPPVVTPPPKPRKNAPPPPPPDPIPDLGALVADPDPRIRRRAALGVGRVGLPGGTALVQPLLADADPEVRQMAAFALGLLGDKARQRRQPPDQSVVAALTAALQDADARVRGRAAEALGLIEETTAAPAAGSGSAAAIGQMVSAYVKQGAIASLSPDDERWPNTPEADAVRLGLFALVRLKSYEPLASAVVDGSGRVSGWWPVAFALQRVGDPRAAPMLRELAATPGRYTRAFAARGLGAYRDTASVPLLRSMIEHSRGDVALVVSAVRALGQIGAPEATDAIMTVLTAEKTDPNVQLEAVAELARLKSAAALPYIHDLVTDEWPTLRAAAIRAAAAIDPEGFPILMSGMEPDSHWIVRAAIADVLGGMPADVATARLQQMLEDQDKRVLPSVLGSLARLKAPGLDAVLLAQLKSPDPAVRSAAARAIGRLRPAGGAAALRDAFRASQDTALQDARQAAMEALVPFGVAEAMDTVKAALADRDWSMRLRAAALLRELDPSADTTDVIRPAPGDPIAPYTSPELIAPTVSPHAFIETAKGTVEIEFTVLDAPQTVQNFIALARRGYFNGLQVHRVVPNFVVQDGDPRGDGSGGPGYSIRDELNDRPFVRGTVGMALSAADTGGSQWFIMHSPAPHLDAKYTVFGQVVNGMEVVDRIQQLDVIQRVRIWDGKELK